MSEGIISRLLSIRKRAKKKKPSFRRQEGYRYKSLDDNWRRPRGRHSKLRKGIRGRGTKPSPGFGSPAKVRGTNSSGLREVMVSSMKDLEHIHKGKDAGILSSALGRKKRQEIIREAEKKGLELTNAYKFKMPSSK